jgi:gamma-glutamylcyclotransferase (GGCT)/AIG2-like uncharacterized protein YtfP
MVSSFFVYGTLKRGQCREICWPAKPLSISPACAQGQLFGRTDYPAMVSGTDRVLGELWTFEPHEVERVIEVLDQIEGTNQAGNPDLYRRVISDVFDLDDQLLTKAYAYLYETNPEQDGFTRLVGKTVRWP